MTLGATRQKKKLRAVQVTEGPPAPSGLLAHCYTCRTATPLVTPLRRERNGVSITTGTCGACGAPTYRIGAARGAGENDA